MDNCNVIQMQVTCLHWDEITWLDHGVWFHLWPFRFDQCQNRDPVAHWAGSQWWPKKGGGHSCDFKSKRVFLGTIRRRLAMPCMQGPQFNPGLCQTFSLAHNFLELAKSRAESDDVCRST
jgi:hypothetical protein